MFSWDGFWGCWTALNLPKRHSAIWFVKGKFINRTSLVEFFLYWKSRKLFSLSYTQYYFWISTCIRSIHSEIFGGNFLLQFFLTEVKFWSNHPPASGFFIDLSCLQLFFLSVSFILFIFNITLTNTHIQKKDTTGNHTIFSHSQR